MLASESIWQPASVDLALMDDEVHVWRASLKQPAVVVDHVAQTLSSDERQRADRLYAKQRTQFIVGRGILRNILGHYMCVEPSVLQFHYTARGKPRVADLDNHGLSFNLSHSYGMAVCAITHGRPLGVDIEYVRPIPEIDKIATAFFSLKERAVLHTIPTDQRLTSFFRCWTRKEAYIKAVGAGVALPLDQFDVTLAPEDPARLERIHGAPGEASCWELQDLDTGVGFISALAVRGSKGHLKCIDWALLQA